MFCLKHVKALEKKKVSYYTAIILFLAITTVRKLRAVNGFYLFLVR